MAVTVSVVGKRPTLAPTFKGFPGLRTIMCGRTSLFIPQEDLESRFDARVVTDGGYVPRYNIAPGDDLAVITNTSTDVIDQFHWGVVPPWGDGPGDGIINARSETVAEKPVFEDAWESRPCLVLSTGFYEWRERNGGSKRPYRVYREDDPAFAMAGLWEVWSGGGDREDNPDSGGKASDASTGSRSCVTILTTEPSEVMEPIHDRMPVVLEKSAEDTWLTADPDERAALCRPYPGDDLDAYEISTRVNDPTNDDLSVIEPLEHDQSGLGEFT